MFVYYVRYWNESEQKENTIHGIVNSDTYGEAANYIADYYGTKNVVYMTIEECVDEVIEFTELNEYFKEVKGDDNSGTNSCAYSSNNRS